MAAQDLNNLLAHIWQMDPSKGKFYPMIDLLHAGRKTRDLSILTVGRRRGGMGEGEGDRGKM